LLAVVRFNLQGIFNLKTSKMNVTLNIENDAELRAYIKDCIKGQVLSVVREEFTAMVQNELERKIKGSDERNFERIKKDATVEAMKSILYKEHSVSRYNSEFIKPYVEAVVKDAIAGKDWKQMVDQLAKEKVRSLIG